MKNFCVRIALEIKKSSLDEYLRENDPLRKKWYKFTSFVSMMEELEDGQASIVNITSIAGSRVHPFAGSAYATSKGALAALTREMAADFGPYGIRVNAIAPGEIDTSILSPGTEELVKRIPLRRLGKPEEVADMIFFLCSDQSNYISGAEIHVNGGQHVQ